MFQKVDTAKILNTLNEEKALLLIRSLGADTFENINKNISQYVIYCDPPYRNTVKYATNDFPYDEFYQWCRDLSKNNIVLISEYSMPSDFKCIWEKDYKCLMYSSKKTNDKVNNRVEKLFIYKGDK